VLKTLLSLGLTEMDAKVYVFLAKKGLQKAIDITKSLKMNKEQLYRSLKKLQSKGIVTATLEHPARFSALPFEKVLDLFVKAKMEEAQEIKQNKDEILSFFQSIAVKETDVSARFTVIEGRSVITQKSSR
jgi:sugar-specific transcriptional regulator TrmB